MARYSFGIRTKLIIIFIVIKVIPLVMLAWVAWDEIFHLGATVEKKYTAMVSSTGEMIKKVGTLSTQNSIQALDQKAREAIERLTTDTARDVAAFLYDRDTDIRLAARLAPGKEDYQRFLSGRRRPVILHDPWEMDPTGTNWIPSQPAGPAPYPAVLARNPDNRRDFHYRKPDQEGAIDMRPTYLEMTFVDLSGQEKIKVTTSDILPSDLKDISDPRNTYCRAERYFEALKDLKPGEIYVSEVIGPYVKGHMIGTYSKKRAQKAGIPFAPQASGYAGKENPVGIRFQGLVRWATPVLEAGRIIGYVTLALDHTHLMEFTDHVIPTAERYSDISDAGSGNYAFMWDYMGRNISHPRDYFIVGYDPETGQQAVPWLDEEMYQLWLESNKSMDVFQKKAPWFMFQSLNKKPAPPLTQAGMLGLDGRYLNFAPQCTGWHTLTQYGGSGSFLIFWSGLWKLTTAAAIPYHTGIYGKHPRGFGYVTIGANVEEFHRPAIETARTIQGIESRFNIKLEEEKRANQALISSTRQKAVRDLTFYTGIMVAIVIIIAVLMATALTRRITSIILGIRRFQDGNLGHRLTVTTNDEMGQLSKAYNGMADTVERQIEDLEFSKSELARHRDNLEELVQERTRKLEEEIVERKRIERIQSRGQIRLQAQNQTLLRLASDESLHKGKFNAAIQVILENAAKTLSVERGSIWMFDSHRLYANCMERYSVGSYFIVSQGGYRIAEHMDFLQELKARRTIANSDLSPGRQLLKAGDADPPAAPPLAMLDASIVIDGELSGWIRFEETGTAREWQMDEQNFANSVADMVALAKAAAIRREEFREKAKLEDRLRRIEKMEAIGTLAGGVAHDLNNILSGLVSYPELLLYQMSQQDPMRKPVETILKAGKRASTIVQDLLTLARRGVDTTEVINLNDIVWDYLASPEHAKIISFHPDTRIITRLAGDLLNIRGSSAHLSKTLMNLVINSAEATSSGGKITLSTANTYVDRPFKGEEMVAEGDYVALTVEDNGSGISEEDMEHIFEPFYTKKKMGRSGTGLGMAVVWGVVKDHHGYIDFESEVGRGTRFTLYFPVTREAVETVQARSVDEYRGDGQSILVVDDVEEQRMIATALLSELGYEVATVESGEKAVDYLKTRSADLLVLDMIMDPGMDGLDTYREVVRLHPKQKAIIASGFSETERIRELMRLGVSQYIKKPYSIEKIGLAVQCALKTDEC